MSFLDIIKNSVMESFDRSISVWQILLGLAVALVAAVFILIIYKRTMRQVAMGRSFSVSLMLICVMTAMMVLTITSNLALSLGMVGALSIVRFRTAIKDPSDTAFLFWAVAAGITAGAGFYMLTLIGCLVAGLVCLLSVGVLDRVEKPFLLVVRAQSQEAVAQAETFLLKQRLSWRLSSCVDTGSYIEAIYELGVRKDGRQQVAGLKEIGGIISVSLVDCRRSG